jgi:hypothetical protein
VTACTVRCRTAAGPDCTCPCNGEHHGADCVHGQQLGLLDYHAVATVAEPVPPPPAPRPAKPARSQEPHCDGYGALRGSCGSTDIAARIEVDGQDARLCYDCLAALWAATDAAERQARPQTATPQRADTTRTRTQPGRGGKTPPARPAPRPRRRSTR